MSSRPPWNCLIFQTRASNSGLYCTLPNVALNFGLSTSFGTGMVMITLLAIDLSLNWERAFKVYSKRLRWCLLTMASTLINGFTYTWIINPSMLEKCRSSLPHTKNILVYSNDKTLAQKRHLEE